MTAHKPLHLVPQLRFPEFRDAGPWEVKRLGDRDIAKFMRERILAEKIPLGHYVSTANLLPDFSGLSPVPEQPPSSSVIAYRKDDILISNIRPYLRKVWMADRSGGASNDVIVIRHSKNVLGIFLGAFLTSDRFVSYVMSGAKGVKMPRGDLGHIQNFDVILPRGAEQQCVADCLGSLDDLIAAEGRKLDALRQHKQGLMQQLFPRPGETVPQLRFPEFSDRPKWDEVPLSAASDINPANDGLPESFIYIDLESVTSGVLVERKEVSRDTAPSRAQRLLRRKDAIYQTVRPYQRNNLFFDIDDEREYVASTGYAQLRAHGCPEFLFQLLHTNSFVNSVLAKCTGSNYPAINSSDLARILVALPQKPEQQKIADCLGSLDDLIAAEGRKLDALRQHKQGLMQKLFPSPDGP